MTESIILVQKIQIEPPNLILRVYDEVEAVEGGYS